MKDQTKRNLANAGVGTLCVIVGFILGNIFGQVHTEKILTHPGVQDTVVEEFQPEPELTLDDHIAMIVPDKLQNICKALIWVESRGNTNALSSDGNYAGILQIGSIYVKECNRIQKDVVYTLEDRYDSVKSLEMFAIVQNHHNPHHDLDRAIYLHNPTAGPEYREEVLRKFKTIY